MSIGVFAAPVANRRKRLQRMQAMIAPPVRSIDESTEDILLELSGGCTKTEWELNRYIELCLQDVKVSAVAKGFKLEPRHMRRIYLFLMSAGMNRWIRGQHAALASLSDPGTLLFVIKARRNRKSWVSIANSLSAYWNDQISTSQLLERV